MFFGVGIFSPGATGNLVQGNFIGTDVTGTVDLGNTIYGVLLSGVPSNTIGGTTAGARNVISGNDRDGVRILAGATGNLVQGNFIGTDVTGTAALANSFNGVRISFGASNNTIGGTAPGVGVLVFINVENVVSNSILSNSIFSNGSLGIDLGSNGVTPNDVGDGDTGANNLQNFPVLTAAASAGGTTKIQGSLNSTPNTQFRLEFFSNTACDPSGHGEGEVFIGSTDATTDGSGNTSFMVTLPTAVPVGQFITSTATDPSNNTSEFSQCTQVTELRGVGGLTSFFVDGSGSSAARVAALAGGAAGAVAILIVSSWYARRRWLGKRS